MLDLKATLHRITKVLLIVQGSAVYTKLHLLGGLKERAELLVRTQRACQLPAELAH